MTLEILDDDHYGGMLGELLLFDESPRLNLARVRPFIAAVLLLRGGVRASEVANSLSCHAHPDDLKSWETDEIQMNLVIDQALQSLVKKKILRDRGDGLFVLDSTAEGTRFAITATSALDAQLPDHLLAEVGRETFTPPSNV